MATGATVIRVDGKLNAQVDITDNNGKVTAAGYLVLVDTGATITMVDYTLAIKGGAWTGTGALGEASGGPDAAEVSFIEFLGGSITIQTEPQGGGALTDRKGTTLKASVVPGLKVLDFGFKAQGLLGMENMDIVQADPQKNNTMPPTKARMAQRAG